MIYLDSSSLLKLIWEEPETEAVRSVINAESEAVVSELTELETFNQLKAAFLGGEYGRALWHRFEIQFKSFRNLEPFEFRPLRASIFQTALRQHRNSGEHHCRTVDRLHLAAMEELEVSRLMTHDDRQARAAQAAGFSVVMPGRD